MKRNTSELSKNILTEVDRLAQEILIPTLHGMSRLINVIALLLLVFFVEPLLSLTAAIFFLAIYLGFIFPLRKVQKIAGEKRLLENELRFVATNESFEGIGEIKISHSENVFLERFERHSREHARQQAIGSIIGQSPRYILESAVLAAIFSLTIWLTFTTPEKERVFQILGLYAFVGYRIMPAVVIVFAAMMRIRFSSSVLELVLDDLDDPIATNRVNLPWTLDGALDVVELEFHYPGISEPAVVISELNFPANSSVAIVGASGSGKSTFLRLLLGFLEPTNGGFSLDGHQLSLYNNYRWQSSIGYVPHEVYLMDATIAQNVALDKDDGNINEELVYQTLVKAELSSLLDFEAEGIHAMVGERGARISGGQRQRLGIARAFYRRPDVLVLDEATSALDSENEKRIFETVMTQDIRLTFVVTHRVSQTKGFDQIVLFDNGVVEGVGSYDQLVSKNSRFRSLLTAENVVNVP